MFSQSDLEVQQKSFEFIFVMVADVTMFYGLPHSIISEIFCLQTSTGCLVLFSWVNVAESDKFPGNVVSQ